MLRTRLWMGTVLVILAAGSLVLDERLAPWFPFLFALLAGLGLAACVELLGLLDRGQRPTTWLACAAVLVLISANWLPHFPSTRSLPLGLWDWVVAAFVIVVLAAFIVEMAMFREPGSAVIRIAHTVWLGAYLGLLPSFLAQIRWLNADPRAGSVGLALAIFVPKLCDVGAYFTGRFLGRHRMTPVLSPKKTWEGAAGGLTVAALTAIALDRLTPAHWLHEDFIIEIAFGITIGVAGMLGDLAESMIKRDCGRKDASQAVPGFGGVLDVVDSVIFPAPLVYFWLRLS